VKKINLQEVVGGSLTLVFGDWILYVVINALAQATPGWASYGWGLFAAFNAFALAVIGHGLVGRRSMSYE
jgi:hypothetical protein